MKTSWWIGIFFVWVVAHMISGTLENASSGADIASMQEVFGIRWAGMSNPLLGLVTLPILALQVLQSLWNVLMFNYPTIFHGDYQYVQIFLWCVTLAFAWSTILALKGTPSV